MARRFEHQMLEMAPDTVLVLFRADPQVIAVRIVESPHTYQIVKEEDVVLVLERFEEEVANSLIQKRIVLDTSTASVAETLAEFVEKYEPFFSDADLLRRRRHLRHGSD